MRFNFPALHIKISNETDFCFTHSDYIHAVKCILGSNVVLHTCLEILVFVHYNHQLISLCNTTSSFLLDYITISHTTTTFVKVDFQGVQGFSIPMVYCGYTDMMTYLTYVHTRTAVFRCLRTETLLKRWNLKMICEYFQANIELTFLLMMYFKQLNLSNKKN